MENVSAKLAMLSTLPLSAPLAINYPTDSFSMGSAQYAPEDKSLSEATHADALKVKSDKEPPVSVNAKLMNFLTPLATATLAGRTK